MKIKREKIEIDSLEHTPYDVRRFLFEITLYRVSAKRTLRFEQTRFLAILNDSYVYYKG